MHISQILMFSIAIESITVIVCVFVHYGSDCDVIHRDPYDQLGVMVAWLVL